MPWVVKLALRLYPRWWMAERGEELEQLLIDLINHGDRNPWYLASEVARSATRERLRRKYWDRRRALFLGISGAAFALIVTSLMILVIRPPEAIPSSSVDLSGYTFDLDQHGKIVGVTPKADLAPPVATVMLPKVLGLPLDQAQSELRNRDLTLSFLAALIEWSQRRLTLERCSSLDRPSNSRPRPGPCRRSPTDRPLLLIRLWPPSASSCLSTALI